MEFVPPDCISSVDLTWPCAFPRRSRSSCTYQEASHSISRAAGARTWPNVIPQCSIYSIPGPTKCCTFLRKRIPNRRMTANEALFGASAPASSRINSWQRKECLSDGCPSICTGKTLPPSSQGPVAGRQFDTISLRQVREQLHASGVRHHAISQQPRSPDPLADSAGIVAAILLAMYSSCWERNRRIGSGIHKRTASIPNAWSPGPHPPGLHIAAAMFPHQTSYSPRYLRASHWPAQVGHTRLSCDAVIEEVDGGTSAAMAQRAPAVLNSVTRP